MNKETFIILGTQVGFILGSMISYGIIGLSFNVILTSYIILNLGYFTAKYQDDKLKR